MLKMPEEPKIKFKELPYDDKLLYAILLKPHMAKIIKFLKNDRMKCAKFSDKEILHSAENLLDMGLLKLSVEKKQNGVLTQLLLYNLETRMYDVI